MDAASRQLSLVQPPVRPSAALECAALRCVLPRLAGPGIGERSLTSWASIAIYSRWPTLGLEELGVPPEFCCDMTEAAARLANITGCTCPLEKLNCIKSCADTISTAVNASAAEFAKSTDGKMGKAVTLDELLPLMIFTLVQAQPRHLATELDYIEMFHSRDMKASKVGFTFANLRAAVEYLQRHHGGKWMSRDSIGGEDGVSRTRAMSAVMAHNFIDSCRAPEPCTCSTCAPGPHAPATGMPAAAPLAASPVRVNQGGMEETPQALPVEPESPHRGRASEEVFVKGGVRHEEMLTELYNQWFELADADGDGKLNGGDAVHFFTKSGLPREALAQVPYHPRVPEALAQVPYHPRVPEALAQVPYHLRVPEALAQ
ncbi:hypothetical protein CYMTET_30397, partial [Cymbomonas tetramitiformis]